MLIRASVRKPYLVVIIMIIVALISALSFVQLKVDYLPNINFPYVVVVVISPGLSPEEVELNLTDPTEDAIQSLNMINSIQSMSNEHVSIIVVELSSNADLNNTVIDLQLSLSTIVYPEGTMEPIISKINPTMLPVMTVAMSEKDKNTIESSDYFNDMVYKLRNTDGVSGVSQSGLVENQILVMMSDQNMIDYIHSYIEPDPDNYYDDEGNFNDAGYDLVYEQSKKIAANIASMLLDMLSVETAGLAIYAQNLEFPVGTFERGTASFTVKIGDKITSFDQLVNMPLISIDFQKAFSQYKGIIETLRYLRFPQEFLNFMTSAEDENGTYQTILNNLISGLDDLFSSESRFFVYDAAKDAYVVHEDVIEFLKVFDAESLSGIKIPKENVEAAERYVPGLGDFIDNNNFFELVADPINGDYYVVSSAIISAVISMNELSDYLAEVTITEKNIDLVKDVLISFKAFGSTISSAGRSLEDFLMNNPAYIDIVYELDENGLATDQINYYKFSTYLIDTISTLPQMLITLKDVAKIYDLNTAGTVHNLVNGGSGVMVSLNKQADYSTVDVCDNIKAILEAEKKANPDFEYIILGDQGLSVMSMINSILGDLLIGACLAVFVLLIFLRQIRATLIVACSMVMSVLATFVLMFLSGIQINILSMSGLSLGIGMLVDNSIVVFENIYRLRSEGKSLYYSCIMGAKQMAAPIISSTLTTIVVFVPFLFLKGLTTQIFRDIALTLTFSIVSSLFMALTFVPMACSGLLKSKTKDEGVVFKKIQNAYVRSLKFTLKHKWVAIVPIILLFAGSIFGMFNINTIFFPATDAGTFTMTINLSRDKLPQDKAYNDILDEVMEHIYTQASSLSYVESVGIELSNGMQIAGQSIGGGDIVTYVTIKEGASITSEDAAKQLKNLCSNMPIIPNKDAIYITYNADAGILGGFLTGDTLSIDVSGNDIDALRQTAKDLAIRLEESNIKGVVEVDDGVGQAAEEYYIVIDKDKAANAGLTVGQVMMIMQEELSEPSKATTITYEDTGKAYSVYLHRNVFEVVKWHKVYNSLNKSTKVFILDDGSFYVTVEGVNYPAVKTDYGFSYTKNEQEIKLNAKTSQLITYYSVERTTPLDLITYEISTIMLQGTSLEYIVTVPLYSILSEVSFQTDAFGDIVYRPNLLEDGTIDYVRDITGEIVQDEKGRDMYNLLLDPSTNQPIPQAVTLRDGYLSIDHFNGKRMTTVEVKYDTTQNVNNIKSDIQKVLDSYDAPKGVEVSFTGENAIITEVYNTLYIVLIFAAIFIYLVIVGEFQSLKLPFIIIFTIPLAFTGSILSLIATGQPLSVVAIVGFIVLIGVVVNNGIVLLDNIKRLIDEGWAKYDAIVETARTRLRPILMTTLTTVIALFSAAINTSAEGAMMRPIAVTTVGGLTYASILTLYFIPIIFDVFDKGKRRRFSEIKNDEDAEYDDVWSEFDSVKNAIENATNKSNNV